MTQMILNNLVTFPIRGYNRYTSINDGKVYSNASIGVATTDVYDDLTDLCNDVITTLSIDADGKTIYSLTNQNGKITGISESLDGDTVYLNLNISFGEYEE